MRKARALRRKVGRDRRIYDTVARNRPWTLPRELTAFARERVGIVEATERLVAEVFDALRAQGLLAADQENFFVWWQAEELIGVQERAATLGGAAACAGVAGAGEAHGLRSAAAGALVAGDLDGLLA